jgi:O-antigen/teichoic acid export membrane protein
MTTNKSIVSYFFSGTIFIGIARVSTIVFGLVSVMIATRFLTTEAYGAYVLALTLNNALVQFFSFGLGLVIPKYLASTEDENDRITLQNTVFHFRLFSVLSIILLLVIFKPFIGVFFEPHLFSDIFTALPFLFFLVSLSNLFESILRGQLAFRAIGVIEFASEATELTLLSVFVIVYGLGFWGLLIAKFVARIVSILLAFRVSRFKHRWQVDLSLAKDMLKFGFPLQIQYIFDFAYSKLDTLIIGSLLGARGVAFYDIARKIPDSLMQLYSVFISVYFPVSANVYATEKEEKTNYILNNSIRLLSFTAVLATLLTLLFGKDIIVVLFSEEYLGSYWVLVLLMFGVALDLMEEILGYSLVAIGQPDKPLYINVVRAVFSLAGNLILLPVLGFMGAAVVYILGNLVALPINVFFLNRKDINPNFSSFVKLMVIFEVLSALFLVSNLNGLPLKFVFAFLFIPFSFLFSIITLRDTKVVFGEVYVAWSKFASKLRNRIGNKSL